MRYPIKTEKNDTITHSIQGFTLVELAIVVIITGLLFIPLLREYSRYQSRIKTEKTTESILKLTSMIDAFSGGAYLCPADASLPPTHAQFGQSNCALATGLAIGTCVGGAPPGGANAGLCRIAGARTIPGSNSAVLVGAIPFATLKALDQSLSFSYQDTMDGWGNRLMYAVSEDLTSVATYVYYNGVIAAIDEFGNPTAGVNNDAHYVIYSVGQDRRGGFSDSGQFLLTCGNSLNSTDFENCDGDSTFVQAGGYSFRRTGGNYYDDHVWFSKEVHRDIWTYEIDTDFIKTDSVLMAGIGTSSPGTELDVQDPTGGVDADIGVDSGSSVFTKNICQNGGSDCFDLEAITGSGIIQCTNQGEMMVGITNGNEECVVPTFAAPKPFDCGAGRWVTGFKTNGDVICYP